MFFNTSDAMIEVVRYQMTLPTAHLVEEGDSNDETARDQATKLLARDACHDPNPSHNFASALTREYRCTHDVRELRTLTFGLHT